MKTFAQRLLTNALFLLLLVAVATGADFYFFNSSYKADLYFKLAYTLDENNVNGSVDAIKYYTKAIKTYEAIDDSQGAITAYIHLGLLHFKFGNVLQVERMVLKALALGQENIPLDLQAKSYLLLASTTPPEKAREYIDKAMKISEELDLQPQIVKGFFLLGKIHEYKAEFEDAERYYLKAVRVIKDHPSTTYFVDMVTLYETLGELYAGGGDTDSAIKFYDEALAHSFRKNPQSVATAQYMKILGDLYNEKKELAKACEFWRKSTEQYNFVSALKPTSSYDRVIIPESCLNPVS